MKHIDNRKIVSSLPDAEFGEDVVEDIGEDGFAADLAEGEDGLVDVDGTEFPCL